MIIIAFAILVSVRLPNVILEGGRFWAEEGTVYFHANWYVPWYQGWFFIHTGYINFAAGFTTWVGLKLGGISYAPAVTVTMAVALQCLPVYIIVTHDFPWRRSFFLTALAASMCALPPLTSEVWMNSITSQFHLGLCAALIFASPAAVPALFYTDCAILAVGALSGPVTCFMFPFFAIATVINRKPQFAARASILGIGALIQFICYLLHDTSIRGGRLSLDALFSIVSLHTVILQFCGIHIATLFSYYLTSNRAANHILWAGSAIFILFYGALTLITLRLNQLSLTRLAIAGAFISLMSFYEALLGDFTSFMTIEFGERYSFIPMAINGLLAVGLSSYSRFIVRRFILSALCVMIFVCAKEYRRDAFLCDNGPNWLSQMQAWRLKTEGVVFVWPNRTWPMRLTANHHLSTRDQL